MCNERVPFMGKMFGLKIFGRKKVTFGRKKVTFGRPPWIRPRTERFDDRQKNNFSDMEFASGANALIYVTSSAPGLRHPSAPFLQAGSDKLKAGRGGYLHKDSFRERLDNKYMSGKFLLNQTVEARY
jgi:hypothetical protein